MMISSKNTQVIKLSDPHQIQEIFFMRNSISRKQNLDPLSIAQDNEATHFILLVDGKAIGCTSVFINYQNDPLPLEEAVSLERKSIDPCAEIYKTVLIPSFQYRGLLLFLIGTAYLFVKQQKINTMYTAVYSGNKELIESYGIFGFEPQEIHINSSTDEKIVLSTEMSSTKLKLITKKYEKQLMHKPDIIIKDMSPISIS